MLKSLKLLSVALFGIILVGSCSSTEYRVNQSFQQQVVRIASLESQNIKIHISKNSSSIERIYVAYNVNKEPAFSNARSNGHLNLWAQLSIMCDKEKNRCPSCLPILFSSDISIPEGDDDGLVISLCDYEGNVLVQKINQKQGVFEYNKEDGKYIDDIIINLKNTSSFAPINVAIEVADLQRSY